MRKLALAMALVLLVAAIGIGQTEEEQRAALQGLLLTLDEVNALLGDGWTQPTIGKLAEEPSGAITVASIYEKRPERGVLITIVTALLEFKAKAEDAPNFFAKGLTDVIGKPTVTPEESVAIRIKGELVEKGVKVKVDDKEIEGKADDAVVYVFEGGEQGIAFLKGRLISFFRANLTIDELLALAKKQLEKIVAAGR